VPRVCTICSHPNRRAIDAALVRGESMQGLAERYRTVGRMSLVRHRKEHLPALLARAYDAEEVAEADRLLARVQAMTARMERWLEKAERSSNYREVRAFAGEWRKQVELLAKLAGELQQEGTVNIVLSAEWIQLKGQIVEALRPHPEALEAVQLAITNGGSGANGRHE
jgi:nitrate reductase assembly molybdenum cofactor insertion protein NarJ